MYRENKSWGAEKIRGELLKLRIQLGKRTIQKIIEPILRPSSPKQQQNWSTFLKNHSPYLWAADFLTVPTIAFKQIYILVILHLHTRKIIHFNVTEHPTAEWTYLQVLQATWDHPAPRYFLCDRDNKFGGSFKKDLEDRLKTKLLRTPYRAPRANAFAERLVGTLRRECLDHFIFFAENHLRKVLNEYVEYYNHFRPHQGIAQQIPAPRTEDFDAESGPIHSRPILNGLHHHYYRQAA